MAGPRGKRAIENKEEDANKQSESVASQFGSLSEVIQQAVVTVCVATTSSIVMPLLVKGRQSEQYNRSSKSIAQNCTS